MTATLLDTCSNLRVGNRRLKPDLRALAVHDAATSLRDSSPKSFYGKKSTLLNLVTEIDHPKTNTVTPKLFLDDGSYMKKSQIETWCNVFDIGPPGPILKTSWANLEAVVSDRNAIAHGRQTAASVGSRRSADDMDALTAAWHTDWSRFIDRVDGLAQSRDFYRHPR